jgi:mRNA interferase RelE/StbE
MERRVIAAMSRFAETGQGDVKRLVDRGAELRLRVGDWRVRFRFDRDAGCIYVIHVKHRSEAYDD